MKCKTILVTALAVALTLTLAGVPAMTATDGPDSETEYQAPDPPGTQDAPEAPTWSCPKCGADCPAPPYGRRAFKERTPRFGRSMGAAHGRHAGRRGGRGAGRGLASDRLIKRATRLELTDAQVVQLEKLAYDTMSQLIDLNSDLEKAQLEMRRQMETDGDDLPALKKHLDTLAKKHVSIQELKLKNWIDSKKVLTEEQKQKIGDRFPRMKTGF
jgi:Spy/CpxP family protein refolding chaperone